MSPEAIQYVELNKLSLRPQVRERADDETIAGLAASIAAVGLLQPLRIVRDGERLIVLDGERRFKAVHSLGWERVACIIEDRALCPAEVVQRQLIANCQRKGLGPLPFARAMRELMDGAGMNVSEAAAACGFSAATVSRHLKLLETPDALQEKVASGELAASTAYEIAKVADPARQIELANEAAGGALSRESVKQRAHATHRRGSGRKADPLPTLATDLGGGRRVIAQGPGLSSLETLIAWLSEFLDACKRALAAGCDLKSLAAFLRMEREQRAA
jgi:ParB family chromosome partitioning protein